MRYGKNFYSYGLIPAVPLPPSVEIIRLMRLLWFFLFYFFEHQYAVVTAEAERT